MPHWVNPPAPLDAMAPSALSMRHLNRATLARQLLLERDGRTPADAVSHLVAMQAQLARPPFIGLWTRLAGFTREALGTLMRRKIVVRATTLRGTIHVMTAADYLRLRACLQPGLDAGLRAILKTRIDEAALADIERTGRAFFATPHTFDELRDDLVDRDAACDVRAIAYAIRLRVPLVQVPTDDAWAYPSQARFQAADRYLGRHPSPCKTLETLARRYLAAYGPATVKDLEAWAGLGGLKAVLESLRPTLVSLKGPGRGELFDLPDAPRPDPDTAAPIRFIPDYDNLVVTRADERVVPRAYRKAVFLPGLRVAPTVLIDGFVAATWKATREKDHAALVIQPLGPLSARAKKAIEPEADALLRFLEPGARTFTQRIEKL